MSSTRATSAFGVPSANHASSPRHRRQHGLSVCLKTRYVQILNATLGLRQRYAQDDSIAPFVILSAAKDLDESN